MDAPEVTYECLRAAGVDPGVLHARRLLIAGCGNAGSNVALSAAVLGIEAAYVDPDRVEAKNVAHSPFLRAAQRLGEPGPFKAQLLAESHAAHSRHPNRTASFAAKLIQGIPLGALRQFDGMLIGIDSAAARAWAARAAAVIGIPTIVAGFLPPTGNFVASANRDADAPCYFCLREEEHAGRASCTLYSPDAAEVHPALQTAAAATMNVAIEVMVRFWHDDLRYDSTVFRLDVGDGSATRTRFLRNPECRGPHERHLVAPAPFRADATIQQVLDLARRDGIQRPVLELQSPFVVSLPCRLCGAAVAVRRPDWLIEEPPSCAPHCRSTSDESTFQVETRINSESAIASLTLDQVGLGPLAWCVVGDEAGDDVRVYELPGSLADVFVSARR